ncbi:MAG: four helix bundle protein [Bacteroidales bacterium]|nr:four helix bundle protein [Bacteroidales bacterium]
MNVQFFSLNFAHRIIRLYQYLTKKREFILSKQVLRSGTSIGANIREAQRGQSNADFISKMKIALKEADETHYWITLLRNNGYIPLNLADSLLDDCNCIIKMLVKITSTAISKSKK